MSKSFRNHIIFAILAGIVLVVSVAMLLNSIPFDMWEYQIFGKSLVKALLLTFVPLIIAAESMVYALKYIIEISMCYKKSKIVHYLNIANVSAGGLIIIAYLLTFVAKVVGTSTIYNWVSYICAPIIILIAIAAIVLLIIENKTKKRVK